MATRASIMMDFTQANAQANRLEELATNLKNLSENDFANAMQDVSGNWKSENSTAFVRKGGQLQEKMSETAKGILDVANTIRMVAQRVYEAELRAIELAEQRTYA